MYRCKDKHKAMASVIRQFSAVQDALYADGRKVYTPDEENRRQDLHRQETTLNASFRKMLLREFASAADMPANLRGMVSQMFPGYRVPPCITHLEAARQVMLPHMDDDGAIPFSIHSRNKTAGITNIAVPTEVPGLQDYTTTLITTDRNAQGYHVCFAYIPGYVGPSPFTVIRYLIADARAMLTAHAPNVPVHFYVHQPAESRHMKERFMRVTMTENAVPGIEYHHQDRIPAGLHQSVVTYFQGRYNDCSAYDDRPAFEAYRRLLVKAPAPALAA